MRGTLDKLSMMELFVSVATNGSFVSAAHKLNISGPSATRGVNLLEENLGVKLLTRTTRSLALTDAGRVYLDECKKIIQSIENAESLATGVFEQPKGHLRVTSPILFGENYLIPIITKFLDKFPDITIETFFTDRNVNLIDEGMDVALRIGHLEDSSFVAKNVGMVRRVLCASPSYLKKKGVPQNLEELKDHKLILARSLTDNKEWHFKNGKYIRVNSRLGVNTMASASRAAVKGWGIANVLSYQISDYIKVNKLKIVLSELEPDSLPIHILYPEGRHSSVKLKFFIEFVYKELKKDPFLN